MYGTTEGGGKNNRSKCWSKPERRGRSNRRRKATITNLGKGTARRPPLSKLSRANSGRKLRCSLYKPRNIPRRWGGEGRETGEALGKGEQQGTITKWTFVYASRMARRKKKGVYKKSCTVSLGRSRTRKKEKTVNKTEKETVPYRGECQI